MVSHKYKCIFIHIPKTGGETILSLFADNDNNIPKHANAAQVKFFLGEKTWNSYYKFTVVRNPFDMAVSMYSHLRKPLYQKKRIIEKYGKHVLNPVNACKIACESSFGEYCKIVFENRQIQLESLREDWPIDHFRNQLDWITDSNDEILVDEILNFENLSQDLSKVLKKMNISNLEIPKKNNSRHSHYSQYYSNRTIEIISRHYQKDIEEFNFVFKDKKNVLDKFILLFKQ